MYLSKVRPVQSRSGVVDVAQRPPAAPRVAAVPTPALPHALSAIGVVQRVTVHGTAKISGGYHDHSVQARKDIFADLATALKPFVSRLTLMNTRLSEFLGEIDLLPAADNPLTVRLTAARTLSADLANNPTPTRWTAFNTRETELLGLNDEAVAAQGYAHDKVRILNKLRQMRKETVGQREYILTQLGHDESWLDGPQRIAIAALRDIKTRVDAAFAAATNAADWTEYETLPKDLSAFQKEAVAAVDDPFRAELSGGWEAQIPEQPAPRSASNYFQQHILDRHRLSSTAAGAGKFLWDDWGPIKTRIDAALASGGLTGPIFNEDGGHPQGRFEIVHVTGAQIGTSINNAVTNTIKLIISRTGRSVVTAYPL